MLICFCTFPNLGFPLEVDWMAICLALFGARELGVECMVIILDGIGFNHPSGLGRSSIVTINCPELWQAAVDIWDVNAVGRFSVGVATIQLGEGDKPVRKYYR